MIKLYFILFISTSTSCSLSAQITDEVYDEFFGRFISYISYTQIKEYKIKVIKYTIARRQYAYQTDSVGRKQIIRITDSLGRKRPKWITENEYYIEEFDSLGMLRYGTYTDSNFTKWEPKTASYLNSTWLIFDQLETLEQAGQLPTNFIYEDTIVQARMSFDTIIQQLVVTNYKNYRILPQTYFVDKNFRLYRDSMSADIAKSTGCGINVLVTYHDYDTISPPESTRINYYNAIRWIYDEQHRLIEKWYGGQCYLKYSYIVSDEINVVVIKGRINLSIEQ